MLMHRKHLFCRQLLKSYAFLISSHRLRINDAKFPGGNGRNMPLGGISKLMRCVSRVNRIDQGLVTKCRLAQSTCSQYELNAGMCM